MRDSGARRRRERGFDAHLASHASTGSPDWRDGLPSSALLQILTRSELEARDVANVVRVCRTWRSALPKHAASRFLPERLEVKFGRWAAVEALQALGEHAKEHAGGIAARLEHEDGELFICCVRMVSSHHPAQT